VKTRTFSALTKLRDALQRDGVVDDLPPAMRSSS
jgi:hypothetical protein